MYYSILKLIPTQFYLIMTNIGHQLKTLSTNRALIAMRIPVHKCLPSPRIPDEHAQLYDPMRLVHVAFL